MNRLMWAVVISPASPLTAPPLTMPMRRTTRTASSKLTASQRIQGEVTSYPVHGQGSAGRLYTDEWLATPTLKRSNNEATTLKAEERVVIRGNPRRDFDQGGVMNL